MVPYEPSTRISQLPTNVLMFSQEPVVAINFGGVGNAIIYIIYENWTNKYDSSFKTDDSLKNSDGSNNTLVLNSTSGTFKNNQDSYPQIKVHNSVTIEKEIITFSSSNLEISNQE
ncbi:17862_t:CDS:2 [Gigaspora rosea]|nr:17862_t:CDS:2 [Gigaspora rosea]